MLSSQRNVAKSNENNGMEVFLGCKGHKPANREHELPTSRRYSQTSYNLATCNLYFGFTAGVEGSEIFMGVVLRVLTYIILASGVARN